MSISDTKTDAIKPLDLSSTTPFIGENFTINYPTTRRDKTQKYLNSTKFNKHLTTKVFNDDLY
jgi:hypothetical protein